MKSKLKKIIGRKISDWSTPYIAKKLIVSQPLNDSLISKAARFVACEMVEGDYLEFGVYQGSSYIDAYITLKKQFENRIALKIGGEDEEINKKKRKLIWENMRFFAFDSFQGLPSLEQEDLGTNDFTEGMYAYPVEKFTENIAKAGVSVEKSLVVKGWFNDTCLPETAESFQIKKASIIWIDADLYSSTKSVLNFITDFLQDGTIIIFDDWFSYKGSPYCGVQKAFYEWSRQSWIEEQFLLHEYQRETWKRISFIASKKPV